MKSSLVERLRVITHLIMLFSCRFNLKFAVFYKDKRKLTRTNPKKRGLKYKVGVGKVRNTGDAGTEAHYET